jgi:hypothetical protein
MSRNLEIPITSTSKNISSHTCETVLKINIMKSPLSIIQFLLLVSLSSSTPQDCESNVVSTYTTSHSQHNTSTQPPPTSPPPPTPYPSTLPTPPFPPQLPALEPATTIPAYTAQAGRSGIARAPGASFSFADSGFIAVYMTWDCGT